MEKANKIKKLALGVALSGALIAGAGYGTYSWYTSEVKATGSVQNTTFELNGGAKTDLGNLFTGTLTPSHTTEEKSAVITNTGQEAMYLRAKFNFDVQGGSADKATLLSAYEVKPTLVYKGKTVAVPSAVDEDGDGWVKVSDLQSVLDKWLPSEDGATSDKFASGDKLEIKLQLKLADTADNRWQGVTFSGDLAVQGKQTDEGAKFEN